MKNILLVTMGLDIGGAETHIVELACALKKRGYHIVCASRGGSYVKALTDASIPHYTVPLSSKKPQSIIQAYRLLDKIVKDENIEIIHAHARIPAFICHFLCKRRNIVMVTTVHGTYSTKFGLKQMSRWGQKTLAVSEDIKHYLLTNYNISEKNIAITINGIDSQKFCEKQPDESLYEELGIEKNGPNILYLGRINFDSGEYAFRLVRLAPGLVKQHPDAKIIVIGSGDRFEQLKELTDKINASLPKKAVFLLGARTDVDRLLQIGDLVVCVSRAALEALSCRRPVLLASDFGYMGNFDPERMDEYIENNFTCRGYEKPDDSVFLNDILSSLSNSGEKREETASAGRKLVIENYSIDKMAEDAISVYQSVKNRSYGKKYDFLILGYYGYNNSGDDALLEAVIHNLSDFQPGLSLCVLSNLPGEYYSDLGIDSYHRFNLFSVIRAIKNSEVLIYGGGNLIQDVTSTKSLLYYISVLFFAQLIGTKTMLYSNGVGPIYKKTNQNIVRRVLNNVDVITLRENSSLEFLKQLGITKPDIYLTADITLTIHPPEETQIQRCLTIEGIKNNQKFYCMSVRNWPQNPPDFELQMAHSLDLLYEKYHFTPLFLPLHLPEDRDISLRISKRMKTQSLILQNNYNAQNLIGLISKAQFVAGMRLHSLIFGIAASNVVCGIIYDEKVRGFLEMIHNQNYMDVKDFDCDKFINLIDQTMSLKLQGHVTSDMAHQLRDKALKNSYYAIELLKRKRY